MFTAGGKASLSGESFGGSIKATLSEVRKFARTEVGAFITYQTIGWAAIARDGSAIVFRNEAAMDSRGWIVSLKRPSWQTRPRFLPVADYGFNGERLGGRKGILD